MTHRQRAGLGVIGLVLVLVAVVASRQTHLVAGSAQATPVPGPPAVGDCVLDALPGPGPGTTVTAASGGTVPTYPAQQIRPCAAARYGEIVAVIATPKPTVVKGVGDDKYLDDPNTDSCATAGVQYVGLTTQLIQRFWRPFLQITFALSKPSPRQEAAGQHWAACIVAPQPSDLATNTRSAQQYGSSIRDALHTGVQRDQLGSCTTTADSSSNIFTIGGCQQPHALELMAFGDSGDHPVSRVQIEVSCQQLAHQLTAMADPTAAGALSIRIDTTDNNGGVITTPEVPAHSNLDCTIASTSTRKLRGSLIALGRQPIPWAP